MNDNVSLVLLFVPAWWEKGPCYLLLNKSLLPPILIQFKTVFFYSVLLPPILAKTMLLRNDRMLKCKDGERLHRSPLPICQNVSAAYSTHFSANLFAQRSFRQQSFSLSSRDTILLDCWICHIVVAVGKIYLAALGMKLKNILMVKIAKYWLKNRQV